MNNSTKLKELNEQQQAIVDLPLDKTILVHAGPGSGKTEVIARRIVKIIEEQPNSKFLALTFGKVASSNVRTRVLEILQAKNLSLPEGFEICDYVQTIHKFAYKHAHEYARTQIFSGKLLYVENSKAECEACFDSAMNRENIKMSDQQKKNISGFIDLLKVEGYRTSLKPLTQEERQVLRDEYIVVFIEENNFAGKVIDRHINNIYNRYESFLKSKQIISYAQSLVYCRDLLNTNKEYAQEVAEKYQHILIDEFQDINIVQFEILQALMSVKEDKSLLCVGDPNQAIFGFAGATNEVFDLFLSIYPSSTTMFLSKNYRSTQKIVNFSSKFIESKSNNKYCKVPMHCANEVGKNIECFVLKSEEEEIEEVLNKVFECLKENTDNTILITYRNDSAPAKRLKEKLDEIEIKYLDLSPVKFDLTKDLKAIIYSALYVLEFQEEGIRNEEYMEHFFNFKKKKLGFAAWTQIKELANKERKTIKEILENAEKYTQKSFRENWINSCKKLLEQLNQFENITYFSAENLIEKAAEIVGKSSDLRNELIMWNEKNFEQYKKNIGKRKIGNIKEVIQESIKNKQDSIMDYCKENAKVFVSTIHSVKGLEFDIVFLTNVLPGILPSDLSANNPVKLLEEANLTYVAITRAKKQIFISTNTKPKRSIKKAKSSYFEKLSKIAKEINTEQ